MSKKLTQEEFEKRVLETEEGRYTVLGEYRNNRTKILMRHNVCGHKYKVTPSAFKIGTRCPNCCFKQRGAKHKTSARFKEDLSKVYGDEYKLVGEYKDVRTKVTIEHKLCGKSYEVTPNAILTRRSSCFHCARKYIGATNRLSHEEFSSKVTNLHNGRYIVVGRYIKGDKKVRVKHAVCGHEWEVRANHLYSYSGCPKCNMSLGERLTRDFLENRGYTFIEQKKFPDLTYKKPLSFDFYLPNEKVLVEYQGVQHYKPTNFGGSGCPKERLVEQKIKDSHKRKYAESKGYKLIEIPYTEDTYDRVELFLKDRLK